MDKTHIVLITLLIYKSVLIGIGVWASRRTNDGDDFFLGGRKLGPIVAALSYSSSAASAWALLGLSGVAYVYGVSTLWVALGSIVSMLLTWFWLAPRLMDFSRRHDHITLTQIVAHECEPSMHRKIVWVSTLIIVFSFVFYVAAQFQAAGTTFSTTFDLSMPGSIALGALLIMIYTLMGGFWAVSMTDAVQGALMAITAIIMPLAAFIAVGGVDGLLTGLAAVSTPAQLSLTAGNAGFFAIGVVVGGLAIGLGTFGQPHLMARIMALSDTKTLRRARSLTVLWYLVVFLGMWFVGLTGHVLHSDLPDSEQIFFVMLDGLFPPVLGAIFLAAVLSAIMSTADSQLLSAAAAIASDLDLGGSDARRVLFISRLTIIALTIASVVLAVYLPDSIFNRVLFAWLALGAAFGPMLFAQLAGIRVRPVGVLLSIISGFSLTVILSFTENAPGDVVERLLPFCVAAAVVIVFRSGKCAR